MTTTHPDQFLLAGQAAAPAGPVDMNIMYLMHHAFRRDLRRFAGAVPATPSDDIATWTALRARWDRFSEVLHHHHSGEDAGIWPWLLERADAEERATLEEMDAEHERIDPLLAGCAEGFARLADPVGAAGRSRTELRAGLSVRVAETRDVLGEHLRHEESDALVILQRHMTAADWAAIEKEHFEGQRALSFLLFVVPWLAEELPPAVLAQVMAEAGLPMRVVLRLGRRRFRRLEDRAFRHLPQKA